MGRFARSQSAVVSERTARKVSVDARPRFSKEHEASARKPQMRPRAFDQPNSLANNLARPGKPKSRLFHLDRRNKKRLRIIGLTVLLLSGLGAGWVLGKVVMGPSEANQPQSHVSAQGAAEDNEANGAPEIVAASDYATKASAAQEPQLESQDQNTRDTFNGSARNSRQARRAFVAPKARVGPGVGIITRPVKIMVKPLKRINPFRLRLW